MTISIHIMNRFLVVKYEVISRNLIGILPLEKHTCSLLHSVINPLLAYVIHKIIIIMGKVPSIESVFLQSLANNFSRAQLLLISLCHNRVKPYLHFIVRRCILCVCVCVCNMSVFPVSYTHLDVYKRQSLSHSYFDYPPR